MVSYRNARKFSRYLVHAKLYPLEQKRDSYKCVTILRKLKHSEAQSQGKLIKLITIYVVMINVSFSF